MIAAKKAEIERLKKIVEQEAEEARIIRLQAEEDARQEEAAQWADAELDKLEGLVDDEISVEVLPQVEDVPVIEETEDGRVKLILPTTPGR